jgi:CHAT domain-containing protein
MCGLALLVGMLIALPASLCAQSIGSSNPLETGTPATGRQAKGKKPAGVRQSDGDREALRRRAEEAADKAAVLRQRQNGKELSAAITLFQESARLFQAGHFYSDAAGADLQAGEIYFTLSKYKNALSSYQEALNLGGNSPELLCRARSRMARTYATTGQNTEAEDCSKKALQECSALPDPKLRAEALEARGEAFYNSGQSAESVELFSRARELFAEAKDENGQAQALLMLAYARFGDQRAESLQLAGEALRLWSSNQNHHGVAEARSALGIFAATTDEFETAQCNYQQSLPVFQQTGDKDNEASVLNGIGYASRETGDVQTSLEYYQQAKTAFASVQDLLGEGEAIAGMGKALLAMRRYPSLLPLYRAKLRLAQQTRNIKQEASALADMAEVYEVEHEYAKAETLYRRALAAYHSADSDQGVGAVLIRLAHLHAGQGRYSQAISFLESARELKSKTGQVEDLARIHYELASIDRRLNRLDDARAAIEKTIEIIESQRLKIAKFDSRAGYFASVHKYYALYIQVLMLLHGQHPEQGFMQLAFEASEKSKVRALLDLLNASGQESPCDELLRRQLAPAETTGARAADAEQAASAAPVLTLKQIQAEIESDGTVLLEYALGDEKSYVWVVDQKQIVAHELPQSAKIRRLARLFRDTLTARQPRSGESLDQYQNRVRSADVAYPLLARQLSRLLLGPMDLARAGRLLIVPDGFLQYIPFSALLLPEAGANHAVLISHHEVVVLPSGSALDTLRRAAVKRMPPTRTAVVIADPVVERDDPRVAHARNSTRKKSQEQPPVLKIALRGAEAYIARLPGSRAEAETIRQVLGPQDVLVAWDFNASRDAVLQGLLEHYRLVHFATHGIIDARHPEMSGLILSLVNESGQQQDGYLRLGDIYKLKLSADLVVLSACNSALGKDLESEGTIGLPRGFLYAGARSVIASLWKVDDEAAADFTKGLYARMQRGESPSSAIRGAQLEMSRGRKWPAPFYWAAFVLQGDYK